MYGLNFYSQNPLTLKILQKVSQLDKGVAFCTGCHNSNTVDIQAKTATNKDRLNINNVKCQDLLVEAKKFI